MNNCSWYLWLGGRRIFNIRQLRENFDTALLIGYFLGGSLMKWLSDLGEYEILKRLSAVDIYGDIGRQLEFAFGVSPDKKTELPSEEPVPELTVGTESMGTEDVPVYTSSFCAASGSFYGMTGSFYGLIESSFNGQQISSYFGTAESSYVSALASSFEGFRAGLSASSFALLAESSFASIVGNAFAAKLSSSYNFSSYAAFVSGQALNLTSSAFGGSSSSFKHIFSEMLFGLGLNGSFTASSFSLGSFGYFFGKYGQFSLGSFGGSLRGSFWAFLNALMMFMRAGSSFGSFGSFGSISDFFGEGSFRLNSAGIAISAEEYHRTLINLSSCPLNAYGYGINLV